MDRRIFGIFLIGALLLASSVAMAQSVGWKTYENEAYNFHIDYPSDWGRDVSVGDMYTMVLLSGPKGKNIAVRIQIIEVKSPKEFKERMMSKDVSIGGITQRVVAVLRDGVWYEVNCMANREAFEEASEKYFNQIINSIKIG